jgi:geranylgeranylglycerol-phosphate geranylgeranyltransferase
MSQAIVVKSKKIDDVRTISSHREKIDFLTSQIILFNYRKRWGLIYALATLTGLFCNCGQFQLGIDSLHIDFSVTAIVLPLSSFLIIIGMYVLNDLIDANLDKNNGKKRPIPAGLVTRKQAIIFTVLTNSIGLILTIGTANQVSMIISGLLVTIGLFYSAPGVALKDKFLLKTLSIAFAMILCFALGASNMIYSNQLYRDANSIIIVLYIAIMLGSMVFITSPFNDIGDTDGDKKAGRKTIPIALGIRNTIKFAILVSVSMMIISWLVYSIADPGWLMPTLVTIVSGLAIITIGGTLNRLHDRQYVRKQHKRSMPLHLLLQFVLILGTILFWV